MNNAAREFEACLRVEICARVTIWPLRDDDLRDFANPLSLPGDALAAQQLILKLAAVRSDVAGTGGAAGHALLCLRKASARVQKTATSRKYSSRAAAVTLRQARASFY